MSTSRQAAPDGPAGKAVAEPLRVLMVCTGNICRSTMAHQILAESVAAEGLSGRILVDSAGISDEEEGNPIDPRAARVLREAGHSLPDHRARQIRAAELGRWDLVLAMTSGHYSALHRLASRSGADAATLPSIEMFRDYDPEAGSGDRDLPDPWYGGHRDFLDTLEVIERTTPVLMEHLKTLLR